MSSPKNLSDLASIIKKDPPATTSDKDNISDLPQPSRGQQLPKQPIVARISLWTTRPAPNFNSAIRNGNHDNDSGNDSGDELDFELDENAQLEQRLKQADLPEYVRKVAMKEVQKLKRTPNFMSDYAVTRSYLELILDLPWYDSTDECIDLRKSRRDLDHDHYGMQKPKERVLQYLAVRKLKHNNGALSSTKSAQPILMFVGPPGTGKTSIAQSIATSLNRKFQRISLGGLSDQSSIRGHRRTYIGAMPGRIIQGIKQAGVNNPVFLLDEVDKMTAGPQGDPSGALLEVLDPEQNHTFTDHYLNMPFDLSRVLFIATANSLDTIPAALLDRMEIIQVAGYTHEEKFNIARRHLVPKQIADNGLSADTIKFRDQSLNKIITNYAREAGVRTLERHISAICRAVAVKIVEGRTKQQVSLGSTAIESGDSINNSELPLKLPFIIDSKSVEQFLGPVVYERETNGRASVPGVAIGLAWTSVGGEITFVEAEIMEGNRKDGLVLTGQLGSVMRESAMLALNWIRANFHRYEGLPQSLGRDLINNTVHVHFPAGSVGKDGPSAGVTTVVALMSLCSGISVEPDLAMTGEITLRGVVLKVGGVKSKVLAAHRAGIKHIILPSRNEPELSELSGEVRQSIKFSFANTIDDVIRIAFGGKMTLKPQNQHLSGGSQINLPMDPSRSLTSKL